MALSMHTISVPVFAKTLGNLSAILDKAAAHAEARKIDPAVLLGARLYPDMFPCLRQFQLATDFAKGASARLAGQEPPKYEDTEKTIAELKARLARTIEFIQSLDAAQFAGAETRAIVLKIRDTEQRYTGQVYLSHVAFPNFFFHATTGYDILRHNGIEIGKRDFVGSV